MGYWINKVLAPKSPAQIAGFLSLLSTTMVLAIWFILLIAGLPSDQSFTGAIADRLSYIYSGENPNRLSFIWLAILPLASATIAGAYLLDFARSKRTAMPLLVSNILIGAIELAFGPFSLAIFVLLPAYWGWKCLDEVGTNIRTDDR